MIRFWAAGTIAFIACAAAARAETAAQTRFSVQDFGASADGTTDDTAAFQAALDAAAPMGGCVMVPPVGAGRGYVLTHALRVPPGVALVGSESGVGNNAIAVFDLPDKHVVGAKIFARPQPSQYEGPMHQPLFWLNNGSTVRGLWILYDQQPMPSDEEFQDPKSPYHYPSFAAAREGFVRDRVKPCGPTFYAESAVNVVIEDVVCDRCCDFLYFVHSGKCHFNRIALHGYKRGFVFQWAPDALHLSNVEWVPNGGPISPGGPYNGKTYTWVYGCIASQPDNIGIQLGQVDGYSFSDVSLFGVHTGIQFGHSWAFPMLNPVTGDNTKPAPHGAGPWGDITSFKIDQCVIGLHLVWPTHLTNRIANALIFTGFDDGVDFAAGAGTGELKGVAKQAAIVVEESYGKSFNTGFTPTLMCANTVVASFCDSARFGGASADCAKANGRVLLLGGDVLMELTGFQVNNPYRPDLLWARGEVPPHYSVRVRGFILNFEPQPDLSLDTPATNPAEKEKP